MIYAACIFIGLALGILIGLHLAGLLQSAPDESELNAELGALGADEWRKGML